MSNKYISEQSNQFKNKIIIVTGSTQGSGAETAKLLANRGAKGITICGRNNKNGNKVKSEIERKKERKRVEMTMMKKNTV